MKKILIDSLTPILQDEKIAKATVGTGLAASMGTILDWLPDVVGVLASVSAMLFTYFLYKLHKRKAEREEELHSIKMQKERRRRKEDPELQKENTEG